MDKIKIDIFVNQLGNLKIQWIIPNRLIIENSGFEIQLPSFKFDLPKVAGLPVPFSSKAERISIENIEINRKDDALSFSLSENFEGLNNLKVNLDKADSLVGNGSIILSYQLLNIVNNDTIYYVFVYPLFNPFSSNIEFEIDVKARFSFKIRKYKFREWYFNRENGKRISKKEVFSKSKNGDLISLHTDKLKLERNTELNIHLTGTRFPIMIRRDIFWIVVFIISLGLILSPVWSAFI